MPSRVLPLANKLVAALPAELIAELRAADIEVARGAFMTLLHRVQQENGRGSICRGRVQV
jgi:hypothetical protein